MSNIKHVDDLAVDLAHSVRISVEHTSDMDTVHVITELARKQAWADADSSMIDFLAKKIDINGVLYRSYEKSGKAADKTPVSDSKILELVFVVIFKAFLLDVAENSSSAIRLKRLNTLFKASDLIAAPSDAVSDLIKELKELLSIEIAKLPDDRSGINVEGAISDSTISPDTMTLPIKVLFYEGPIARAYLETMRSLGFKPEKIICLIPGKDLTNGKPVGRWLPKGLRLDYVTSIQKNHIHFWSKKLAGKHPELVGAIRQEVDTKFGISEEIVTNANALHNLSRYCDSVDSILIEDFKDPALLSYINDLPSSVFLYTGGGIVPAKLLDSPQHRFLHIHPGYLPDIRGADCVLWSALLSGHFSASCFYMAPGIDVGDIILPLWLPELKIEKRSGYSDIDTLSLYRSLFCFLDPWVRAFALHQLLRKHQVFDTLQANVQQESDGNTFHFMHPEIQASAISSIIVE